jgi:site-specific DNA-cytosine methylase
MVKCKRIMKIRALDLFCGAGGSSWGARQAGIEIVAAFDLWPLAGEVPRNGIHPWQVGGS